MKGTELELAFRLQHNAAELGFDWPDVSGVWNKLWEELSELRDADSDAECLHELGDVMFCLVNLARFMDIDAEAALKKANQRFQSRFNYVESRIRASGSKPDLAQMECWWQAAKRRSAE